MTEKKKTRYSDNELQEFKQLIITKLEGATKEFNNLQRALKTPNENDTESTSSSYITLDDGQYTFEKENLTQQAARIKKFIDALENALIRIENKTYGICRVTGNLIKRKRLEAVPHTTLSMEAKLNQYK
jgi:RNA polymerase-binding transcription factor DksA